MAAVTEALGASLAALATAGASRHVVAAALAAGLRVIAHLSGVAPEPDPELGARLTALRVVLSAQQAAARDGHPQHSARGLVSADELLMANAARHQFSECFERATPASARRSQRGQRKPRGTAPDGAPQSSSSEAEPGLAVLLRSLELRVRRLEERAAPDALGVWFADASASPSHDHADDHNDHHHDDHPDQESPEVHAPCSTTDPEDADTVVAVLFPDLAASAAAAPAAAPAAPRDAPGGCDREPPAVLEEAPPAAPAINEAPTAPAAPTDDAAALPGLRDALPAGDTASAPARELCVQHDEEDWVPACINMPGSFACEALRRIRLAPWYARPAAFVRSPKVTKILASAEAILAAVNQDRLLSEEELLSLDKLIFHALKLLPVCFDIFSFS